jgi:hypothetical protein
MPKNPNGGGARRWAMPDDVRRWLVSIIVAVFAFGWSSGLAAQPYPVRPITMIVPFPAGGATDTLARYLAEKMREILGQPIIIENVGGAAGSIGVGRAVRAPADGYTLSIGTSTTHMLTGGLYSLPFDILKDLEPVIYIGSEPLLIAGRKNLPADDLKGLIAYLKANPDKVSVGIAGVGAAGHLAGIAFRTETATKFQFVPYRGNAPAMQDLLAGQIADRNWQHQTDRGDRHNAAAVIAQYSDRRGSGPAGFYGLALVRALGAKGYAKRHCREAQRDLARGACRPLGAKTV